MELKEQIAEELKKYIDKFDKYDKELPKLVEEKERKYQEKKKEFDEKWGEDIFPTDIPIKEKEQKQLTIMEANLKRLKETLNGEINENESNLKSSILSWKNKIDERRKELVEYVTNKDKYLEQRNRLEKELKMQFEGIKTWEKNGIDPNDILYHKRKYEIIPNLENQISDINLKLDEKDIRKEYFELGELNKKIKEVELHDRKHILPELAEIFEISKDDPTKPEPIKPEPIKPEPTKPEPTKPEPTKPEPIKPEPIKPEPTKPEPTKPEPTKPESVNPTLNSKNKGPFVQIIIGRKIKVKFAKDGKEFPIVKSKEFFEYTQSFPKNELAAQLFNKLNIEDNTEAVKLNVR